MKERRREGGREEGRGEKEGGRDRGEREVEKSFLFSSYNSVPIPFLSADTDESVPDTCNYTYSSGPLIATDGRGYPTHAAVPTEDYMVRPIYYNIFSYLF